jgi:NIMA (never in mitosis gene a)-related kinase
MEYCERSDLSNFIGSQMGVPLNEMKVWKIAIEILSGLAALHEHGVIHRDVKAKNIFMTKKFNVKIGDLGICAQIRSKVFNDCREIGTLLYASPEICKGEFYSTKTDIWSFGCVLYELCTYRHPFTGSSEISIISKILKDSVVRISEIYSKELWFVIERCLRKDPNERLSAIELLSLPCNPHTHN